MSGPIAVGLGAAQNEQRNLAYSREPGLGWLKDW
jgi:hypothetical protein